MNANGAARITVIDDQPVTFPERNADIGACELDALLTRAQAGDEAAVAELFDRYYFRVIGFVRRYVDQSEVEDITQEVFVRVFQNLPNLKQNGAFEGYLFQAAKNRCINWLRSKRRLRDLMDVMWYAVNSWRDGIADQDRRQATSLDMLMETLPDTPRRYLEMFYVEKHSRSEMAALLKESPATVYRKLAAARAELLEKARKLNVSVVFEGRHGLSIQDRG
jgi:RNA polymerase sigma factor (sigma-70 family)